MKTSPPKQLGTLGQSIWLDYIRKDLITGGELRRLIKNDGLRGITSNPSIFSFVPAVCMARAGVIL